MATGYGRSSAGSALRGAAVEAGRKPAKRYRLAAKPAAETAAAAAFGPGIARTAMPGRGASATSQAPGSASAGVPASLISAACCPSRSKPITLAAAARSLCSCSAMVRVAMPKCASSVREVRVSSQAIKATERRVSMARALKSARLPIGVATTNSVPVNRALCSFVKRAMNREGARAEDLCADLMRAAGLKLVERNWRCRLGEIDLIAEDRGGTLVFAEVRMRSPGNFGGAAESVTAAKRSRIIAAARLYLTRRPETICRFDVFLIDGPPRHVQWIRNAFGE